VKFLTHYATATVKCCKRSREFSVNNVQRMLLSVQLKSLNPAKSRIWGTIMGRLQNRWDEWDDLMAHSSSISVTLFNSSYIVS